MLRRDIIAGSAKRVVIEYVDADGDPSVREIMPSWLGGTQSDATTFNATHLEAHCYLRKGRRTFLLRRIQAISDPRTGEVYDVGDWFRALKVGDIIPLDDGDEAAAGAAEQISPRRFHIGWRMLLGALAAGYAIGRLRVIPWVLALTHQKWGHWL